MGYYNVIFMKINLYSSYELNKYMKSHTGNIYYFYKCINHYKYIKQK